MILIGLSGKKQSGKDTTARIMQDLLQIYRPDLVTITQSFANPLKVCASIILGCPVEHFESETKKQEPAAEWLQEITKRQFLQLLGTQIAHHISPSIWADRMFHYLKEINRTTPVGKEPVVIFTDVRFPTEAGKILINGGHLLRLHRPALEQEDTAPSETALDDYTFKHYIFNPKNSIKELEESVLAYLIRIKLISANDLSNRSLLSSGDRVV